MAASKTPPGEPLRIAAIGVSHWHFPLYAPALHDPGLRVVAVSDPDPARRAAVAARFGAAAFASPAALLASGPIDFAFAFAPHDELPSIGALLADSGIPFAIEKPAGTDTAGVARLCRAAVGHFVAVPLVQRISDLLAALADIEGGLPGRFRHVGFRFIAGPPERYIDAGCAWMLDPAKAGGGCAINLAPHFIDLFHLLTGETVSRVSAVMRPPPGGDAVETHAALILTGSDGAVGTIETGYTYPSVQGDQREFSFSLASEAAYVRSDNAGLRVRRRGAVGGETIKLRLEADHLYADFVRRTLDDLRAGRAPIAGPTDALRIMQVLDAAYRSARAAGRAVAVEAA